MDAIFENNTTPACILGRLVALAEPVIGTAAINEALFARSPAAPCELGRLLAALRPGLDAEKNPLVARLLLALPAGLECDLTPEQEATLHVAYWRQRAA